MPGSFHVARVFAVFCSPALPFSLSCQCRGEHWVASIVSVPWLVLEKGDILMVADLQPLLSMPKSQKWGYRERRSTALEQIQFIPQQLRVPVLSYISVLSCSLLPRGEHPPRWLSTIVMSTTPNLNPQSNLCFHLKTHIFNCLSGISNSVQERRREAFRAGFPIQ